MEFLSSFLRRHLAGKTVLGSPNVGFFLRLPKSYLGTSKNRREVNIDIDATFVYHRVFQNFHFFLFKNVLFLFLLIELLYYISLSIIYRSSPPRSQEQKKSIRLIYNSLCCILARCWSYVGQAQILGGQSLSIGHGCGSISTVSHELMHALGFFHTSSRYDRDSYVIVRQDNIIQGKDFNAFF